MSGPFDKALLARAGGIASRYRLTLERDEAVGYIGATVEMPFVMADGPTVTRCAEAVLEATTAAVATMLERRERPPAPARSGKREVQLNIRLTADERAQLEESARRAGFRTIADFVRTVALERSA